MEGNCGNVDDNTPTTACYIGEGHPLVAKQSNSGLRGGLGGPELQERLCGPLEENGVHSGTCGVHPGCVPVSMSQVMKLSLNVDSE